MWAPKRKGAIVKRVIGIPGDEVTPRPSGLLKSEAMVVPVGHIWVEGDNESNSVDSNSFGVVPVGNVIGKVSRVALPQNSSQAGRTWLTLTPRIPEPERLKINSAFNTGNTELLLTKMDRRI
jgi:signal peptidase I